MSASVSYLSALQGNDEHLKSDNSQLHQDRTSNAPSDGTILDVKFRYLVERSYGMTCLPSDLANPTPEFQELLRRFPKITQDEATYLAIRKHFGFAESQPLDEDEKLIIACMYQKLENVHVQPIDNGYRLWIAPPDVREDPNRQNGRTTMDNNGNLTQMGVSTNSGFGRSLPLSELPTVANDNFHPTLTPLSKLSFLTMRQKLVRLFPVAFCYPRLARPIDEIIAAIREDPATFQAVVLSLSLKQDQQFTEKQKRAIFDAYLQLSSIAVLPLVKGYEFHLTSQTSASEMVDGLVTQDGTIVILMRKRVSSSCPA